METKNPNKQLKKNRKTNNWESILISDKVDPHLKLFSRMYKYSDNAAFLKRQFQFYRSQYPGGKRRSSGINRRLIQPWILEHQKKKVVENSLML